MGCRILILLPLSSHSVAFDKNKALTMGRGFRCPLHSCGRPLVAVRALPWPVRSRVYPGDNGMALVSLCVSSLNTNVANVSKFIECSYGVQINPPLRRLHI